MKKNLLFIIFVVISLAVVAWVFIPKEKVSTLISPETIIKKRPEPTPTPTPLPKTFEFNKDTDLEGELESINPQTQDSDFTDLKNLVN